MPVDDTGIYDTGIDYIGGSAQWLRDRLRSQNLSLSPGCELAKALALLDDMRVKARAGAIARYPSPEEAQAFHLKTSGADFLSKALERGYRAGLKGFESHLAGLCSSDPVLTSPTANSTTARNKSWELLLASLAATFATNVRAEEPDVVVEFNGRSVGLAAKVLYSSEPKKHLKRIVEGAAQIDAANVEEGFVVVNLVEQFPHGPMFRNFVKGNITTADEARHILDQWMVYFADQYDLATWGRRLKDKSKLLSVLFFLPTLLHVQGREMPLVPYYRIHVFTLSGREGRAKAFEFALNNSCQGVLGYHIETPLK